MTTGEQGRRGHASRRTTAANRATLPAPWSRYLYVERIASALDVRARLP
jgi:hypothetical protein